VVTFPDAPPRHAPSTYCFPISQPVVALDAKTAFQGLTEREQLYAHHLSRASFAGGLIVLLQTSVEAPQIYRLIQTVNTAQPVSELKAAALALEDVSREDFQAFLVYCSGLFTNMGNYKGFGDFKFVPDLTPEKFFKIIKASKAYKDDPSKIDGIWESVKDEIFLLTDQTKQLGLGKKGVTKYFSANNEQEDSDKVNRFFKENNVEGYINRVIKKVGEGGKESYEIRHAGAETSVIKPTKEFEGADFTLTSGDYGELMAMVNAELQLAEKYSANDNEKQMIQKYIESFQKGSLDAHKDGSRFWIKNKGPAVENYIGFIETYRDPVGMRGEFEGFVAMVNREQSAKFQGLVDKAETLLPRLPWPGGFEKDTFLRPDFTSLDVLTFAGSGIPAGINIPNYDEIRQSEGFKNVNLGNVISSSYKADKKTAFLTMEDHILLEKIGVAAFELQVGLHELLGHGSGKLLYPGNHPEDLVNPLTSKPVNKTYEKGETYDSVFTSMGSSYEECRAECVGLYLSCDEEALDIFGHTDPQARSDVVYVNWLELCLRAVKSLELYSPPASEWKQAHGQARFVILQVLLEAGEGFLDVKAVKGDDGKPDLLLTMDRSKIQSVGKQAIGAFLQKLQVYKSTGDLAEASKMYMKYSAVDNSDKDHPWAEWRDIVVDRKQPRKMMVQANTVIRDEKLELLTYEASHEGMMDSWRERFSPEEHKQIDNILLDLYIKDRDQFKVTQ